MKRHIDHFLLGLLWLLALTLGACFWFGTRFGFNIFYTQHWGYLGRLQASNTPVAPAFYISMVIIAFLMIGGLYIIVRPRFRKIRLPVKLEKISIQPAPASVKKSDDITMSVRPQRPTLQKTNNYFAAAPTADYPPHVPTIPPPAPTIPARPDTAQSNDNFAEIEQIFENTGFLVKNPPKIGNLRPALFAIGADEVLWLGAVGIEAEKLSDAIKKLDDIFTETLEDIKINIRAFLLNPRPDDAADFGGIEKFDSIENLRDYINNNKNTPDDDYDAENFDAYSEYIDTVVDYFNKL